MISFLETNQLLKRYRSGFTLGPVSLSTAAGEIIGIVGVNGSGKTTLIRLLAGVLRPTAGFVRIEGRTWQEIPKDAKQLVGHMDEDHVLYDWMSYRQLEQFLKPFFPAWDSDIFSQLLEKMALTEGRRIGQLSKGNKAKLALAAVLARRPRLLLLDEPTAGMDPGVRRMVLQVIQEYVSQRPDATVMISSHITTDLERISDRIVVLSNGNLTAEFSRAEFSNNAQQSSLEDRILDITNINEGGRP